MTLCHDRRCQRRRQRFAERYIKRGLRPLGYIWRVSRPKLVARLPPLSLGMADEFK
jgi:hypothetical protein